MYNQIQISFYIFCALCILLIPIIINWYRKRTQNSFLLVVFSSIILVALYLFYSHGKNTLIKKVESKLEIPIPLKSYHDNKGCNLILFKDFSYKIICNKELVKEGGWDIHFERSSPKSIPIITVDDEPLGFHHLEIESENR